MSEAKEKYNKEKDFVTWFAGNNYIKELEEALKLAYKELKNCDDNCYDWHMDWEVLEMIEAVLDD